jgi:hypothetical protein
MSSLSKAWETKGLKWISGKEQPVLPTTWIALYTTEPTRIATGTEAAYTGYKRVKVEASKWKIVEGTETEAGYMVNEAKIEFPECTAGESKIKGSGLATAETSGEQIAWTVLSEFIINTTYNLPYIPVEGAKFIFS